MTTSPSSAQLKHYRRETDGAIMVEVAPHNAVNLVSARALGLLARDIQFRMSAEASAKADERGQAAGGEGRVDPSAISGRQPEISGGAA
jgi:hypothetical protein